MSWRIAAAELALPEKEHKSMIEFLKTAITRGPDPLRTRPASPSTVWLRETLSTLRVELVTALPARKCYMKLFFGLPSMPGWRRPPWLPAPLRVGPGFGPHYRRRVPRPAQFPPSDRQNVFVEQHDLGGITGVRRG
jgi:hypothetical protein